MGAKPSKTREASASCQACFGGFHPLGGAGRLSDPIGSPMPDTPLFQRNRRKEALDTVVKQNRPKSSRDDLISPHYSGEKEVDTDSSTIGTTASYSLDDVGPPALVHEGEDCEQEMHEKYQLMEVLGVGSTSTCHRCANRSTNVDYACKIIDKRHIEERFHGMMEQFHTEIEALRSLNHPNIIKLYDVYITTEKIFIVMELMEGGELFDYVVEKGTLTEEEASGIVRKVTSALVYMHSKNIVHRDLKPENLLLRSKPNPATSGRDVEVKIIDFGLSKCMEDTYASSFLGTRGYLAPEMLQRRDYTRAVDTWALGVIIFVLLCGCLPFDDDSQAVPSDDVVRARFALRFPRWAKNLSASAKDLLSKLLNLNPLSRYTAEQALNHPWVTGEMASGSNLLASPGHIRKSPNRKTPKFRTGGNRGYKPGAAMGSLTPPKCIVRKTSI